MAKRAGLILRAGRAVAEIMRSGEGRLIALLAGFGAREIANGWMRTRRARRQYRAEVARIAAGMQAEAEREVRARLTEAYGRRWEDVAEEIDVSTQRRRWEDFAEEVSNFGQRMDADLSEAQRAAEDAARELMDEVNRQFLASLRHMRREMDDVYRQVIEAARDARNTQEQTVTRAVQDALTRFAMRGVVGFQDAAGRNWGLPEYSEMAMRTAVQRMSMISTMIGMLESGRDLCFVNAHDGACPVCALWEGRLMSLTGATPGHPKLADAMLAGLFHPNCAHILQVYDPETSDLTLGRSDITDAESAKLFRDGQRQRYIERQIRAHKRALAAAVTPQAQEREKRDIAYWQKRARDLVAENPRLTRRYDRESLRNYPAPAKEDLPGAPDRGIIESEGEEMARIQAPIEQRNTGKGNPGAILHYDRPLNNRQQRILDRLPEKDSQVTVRKRDVSMNDLSALTAYTGVEYAMFTNKGERLIVRGDAYETRINEETLKKMHTDGWRWSGHTHPGTTTSCLLESPGDKAVLRLFEQRCSCIYNSVGKWEIFDGE